MVLFVLFSTSVFAEEDPFANVGEPKDQTITEEDPFAGEVVAEENVAQTTQEEDPFANTAEPTVQTEQELPDYKSTNTVPKSSNPFIIMTVLGVLGLLLIGFIAYKIIEKNQKSQ